MNAVFYILSAARRSPAETVQALAREWLVLNFRKFISQSRRSVARGSTVCDDPYWFRERKKGFSRVKFTGKDQSFHFDTEDTGPAYTQVQIQHRSRAPGSPHNSRSPYSISRRAAGPGRETLSPARSP